MRGRGHADGRARRRHVPAAPGPAAAHCRAPEPQLGRRAPLGRRRQPSRPAEVQLLDAAGKTPRHGPRGRRTSRSSRSGETGSSAPGRQRHAEHNATVGQRDPSPHELGRLLDRVTADKYRAQMTPLVGGELGELAEPMKSSINVLLPDAASGPSCVRQTSSAVGPVAEHERS